MLVQIVLETISLNQMMGRKFPYLIYFPVFSLTSSGNLRVNMVESLHSCATTTDQSNHWMIALFTPSQRTISINSMCNETDEENASSNYNGKHKQAL